MAKKLRNEEICRLALEGQTLRELSDRYGISRERVRQLLARNHIRLAMHKPKLKFSKKFGKLTTRERFMSRVKKQDDHWIFTKEHRSEESHFRPYSYFVVKGRIRYAHHVAFYLTHGRWPLQTLRRVSFCDEPFCVSPDHWTEKRKDGSKGFSAEE
jgi:predicted DNA-binding protein YlxM (UPF0122 family)